MLVAEHIMMRSISEETIDDSRHMLSSMSFNPHRLTIADCQVTENMPHQQLQTPPQFHHLDSASTHISPSVTQSRDYYASR
jgi:hypothetical protein